MGDPYAANSEQRTTQMFFESKDEYARYKNDTTPLIQIREPQVFKQNR